MSGTLHEARGELRSVYGLDVVRVPLARASRRRVLPPVLCANAARQRELAMAFALDEHAKGRPVLVGTDSVAESETLSRLFETRGVPHQVLNARQDENEAGVVEQAGRRGAITIATNMAGRGTDIVLEHGVNELGGLHVICCQHGTSRRIERQLLGRCARRGDQGSAINVLAIDRMRLPRIIAAWLARVAPLRGSAWLVRLVVYATQMLVEKRQRTERRILLEHDARAAKAPALGRPSE
jgi:preprotein translocase subunit SecA